MLTAQQVTWAKSHDWFAADCRDGTQLHSDGRVTSHEESIHWTQGFTALRDWAGY